jgi:hypothetical protein
MEDGRHSPPAPGDHEEEERFTPWIYPKHHQELTDRPEDWLDGTDHYSLDRCDHYPRGRMHSHPAVPKKGTTCIKASPWVYPEHHQEFTDRPKGYLGGGYGDSQREMEHHYAMNRPAPIKIAGSNSVKNSPFFHK